MHCAPVLVTVTFSSSWADDINPERSRCGDRRIAGHRDRVRHKRLQVEGQPDEIKTIAVHKMPDRLSLLASGAARQFHLIRWLRAVLQVRVVVYSEAPGVWIQRDLVPSGDR
jgi:hypothetical protein